MKTSILFALCLCISATAAPLPPMPTAPTVKRPKPLLSPKAASTPKSSQMFRVASEGDPYQPPLLPMTMEVVVVSNVFGKYLFTASALQPANNALSFEASPVLGDWVSVGYFGPVPDAQTSFVSQYSNAETLFVRARLIPIPSVKGQTQTGWMPASLTPVVGAAGKVYTNPNLQGARAWSVRR